MAKESLTSYLTRLITEKGRDVEDIIQIEGQIGLTWKHLIDFLEEYPEYHNNVIHTICCIDFKNGDVFHYLTHLANGMVKATQG